ncbi:hypothetical protein Tco_0353628 [Tanacetum coccineum]
MDANKKVDLEHVQCPPESKILTNIIKNHPLRFSIAASSSVPWIYMAQFWHTLKEDGSKYRLKFMLDKKELSLTLDDFRTIFHLPHANDNNHNSFVPPPSFSLKMVPFYKQQLGFTMELKTSSSFKTYCLLQPWQTLCKIFSKCLTTRDWMGSTAIADNANDVLLCKYIMGLCGGSHKYQVWHANPDWISLKRDEAHRALQDGRYTYLFGHFKERFLSRKSFDTLANHLQEVMVESLPIMVDTHIKEQVKKQVPEQVRDQVPVICLKVDNEWKVRKELKFCFSTSPKTTPLVQSCQRDPEAPALSLINQDLLYLKKGSSGQKDIARRANECIVSITEPDYKNLNKNDIEDMYLLIMNGKVPDYAETGLLWSLSVFIRSSVI